jgi:glycopeptide antibiotics resistance protein
MIQIIDRFIASRSCFWLRRIQFALALLIFTAAALMPGNKLPTDLGSDKLLHMFGNMLLFLSASVAFMGRTKLGILVLMLVPYSLLIEAGQWLSPGRQVDLRDVWANLTGLGLGYALAHLCEWIWCKVRDRAINAE